METRPFRLVDGTAARTAFSPFETEFAKDRWDAHNIPGLRYPAHTSHYYIGFTIVPANWRPLIKEYAKYLVAADRTSHTIDHLVRRLGHFLHFFSQYYPLATDLRYLSTQDIDDFTAWIRADVQLRKLKNSNTHVSHHIQALAGWLSYLERSNHPVKPHLPLSPDLASPLPSVRPPESFEKHQIHSTGGSGAIRPASPPTYCSVHSRDDCASG